MCACKGKITVPHATHGWDMCHYSSPGPTPGAGWYLNDRYTPINVRHYEDMLNQFRKASDKADLQQVVQLWIWSSNVARADITHALNLVERERGWHV